MVFTEWFGISLFAGTILALFLLVPLPRIKDLLLVGFMGGGILAFVLLHLMQNVWDFWTFIEVEPFTVMEIPFFLSLSWFPIIIIYSHLLSQYRSVVLMLLLLISFPLAATLVQAYLLENQLLVYQDWNLILTFLLSLGIHLVISWYLFATDRVKAS